MSTSSLALRTSVLALSVVGMSAQAEWRCDCATILDACNATVTVEDDGGASAPTGTPVIASAPVSVS